MTRHWMLICAQLAVLASALLDYVCASENKYGTLSVVGPAFMNREVTLKATPFYPLGCKVEWRYIMEGGTQLQTMNGPNVKTYSEEGSFFLRWRASIKYNRSEFYAGCSKNKTIRTRMVPINLKDIFGKCGALEILSPVVRGAGVELGYFPSDYSIQHQTYTERTWKNNIQDIQLRAGSYEEKNVSEYLYILTIFGFKEKQEGTYILNCNSESNTNSVQLQIPERPSYPVIGPHSTDFNTTECIYVNAGADIYCKTNNGTEPIQVELLLGHFSSVLTESKLNKGLYLIHDIQQQMNGLSRRNVTCQVSNAALRTPYKVHGILCNVEEGDLPMLIVPEFLDGENSTTICEVRNAIPAPEIEIHVDKVLLADAQQTDLFNGSSHTFTSLAKVAKANKTWNGKQMCCTRKIIYDIGLNDETVCKYINMKYPPSDLSMSVNKIHEYKNNTHVYFLDMSCETNESNPPCTIEWSSGTDNLRYVRRNNRTNGDSGRYRSVSNVLVSVTKDMAGTITCATRCDHFPSHLNTNYTLSLQGDPTLIFNTTSPIDLYPTSTVTVKCHVDDYDSKEQWALWWKDENSTVMKTCNKTDECLLTLNYARDGENIYACNAWKTNELLRYSLTVISTKTDGSQSYDTDIHTFRFPVNNVLIGAGVICGLCILFVIGRCIYLKRRKVNTTDTVELVENHSDTSSDNVVLHIATDGVQYAVVQRQAATQRIETQNPQDDECLTYAELDVKFLQAANARVPSRKKNTPTKYADIEFFSTQGAAVEHPGYHYASV